MDLTYPADAEEFRAEIRGWLEDNLPEGWFDDDFSMTTEERRKFQEEWTHKLFDGGWICASWPKEYGGKGLSIMESVVLNEEFARAGAPAARRLLRRHARRSDDPAMGQRGAEEGVPAQDPLGTDLVVPGLQRARRRL